MPRRTVVYPGTFDPVTNGHLDIVQRAARIFDSVIVAVTANPLKSPTFSAEERVGLLSDALRPLIRRGRVSVEAFDGLLVRYVRRRNAVGVVRGLRAVSDFEYEFQMALMNRHQEPRVETIFLMPDAKYTSLASTLLQESARLGGDIRRFVPPALAGKIRKKLV
ncbi:MAG: pantetheine-phosphate adenylyltransferase [Elusimicrobiota bacterium]